MFDRALYFLPICRHRYLRTLVDDFWHMSCAQLLPNHSLNAPDQFLREDVPVCHFYEKDNDFIDVALPLASNAESIVDLGAKMLEQDIVDLTTPKPYAHGV